MSSRPSSSRSRGSVQTRASVPPATPLADGTAPPPHSMSPGEGGQQILEKHASLLQGATRVVMLRGDQGTRPAVWFGGQQVRAQAMLVGGTRTRPSPLYKVQAVVDGMTHLRSPGADAGQLAAGRPSKMARRLAHRLLGQTRGRCVRLPPFADGTPQPGAKLLKDDLAFNDALVDALGVQMVLLEMHKTMAAGDRGYPTLATLLETQEPGDMAYEDWRGWRVDAGFMAGRPETAAAVAASAAQPTSAGQSSAPSAAPSSGGAEQQAPAPTAAPAPTRKRSWLGRVADALGFGAAVRGEDRVVSEGQRQEAVDRIKAALVPDLHLFLSLLEASPSYVSQAVHERKGLRGVSEGVLRTAGEENKALLDLMAAVIYLRVGSKYYDDQVRVMGTILRAEMQGLAIVSTRKDALAALREHCPVTPSQHLHITENWVPGSKRKGAVGFWIEPQAAIDHRMSFGTFRSTLEGEEVCVVCCIDGSPIYKAEGITVLLMHFVNARGLWQHQHHEFILAAWNSDESEESMMVHVAPLLRMLKDMDGELTPMGYKVHVLHVADGLQRRSETGQCSAKAGSNCDACTNLSKNMGDFTRLMPMDVGVRWNWEVMTRARPKASGVTKAQQLKLDGGVEALNVSGRPSTDYCLQVLHVDLRVPAVTWKKCWTICQAEHVLDAVKARCQQHSIKLKLGERTETAKNAGRPGILSFQSGDVGKVLKYAHRGESEGLFQPLKNIDTNMFECVRVVWKMQAELLSLITSRFTHTDRWPELLVRGMVHGFMLNVCLDVQSPTIHQLGQHSWWYLRALGDLERKTKMMRTALYALAEHASEVKHGVLRDIVRRSVSTAQPPLAKGFRCSSAAAPSCWSGKNMRDVLSMLLGMRERDEQFWSLYQLFPNTAAGTQASAALRRADKRRRGGGAHGPAAVYRAGADGLEPGLEQDTEGEDIVAQRLRVTDRVQTPQGSGSVADIDWEKRLIHVLLDGQEDAVAFDAAAVQRELTILTLAAQDSEDEDAAEERAAQRLVRTLDSKSVAERTRLASAGAAETVDPAVAWGVGAGEGAQQDAVGIGSTAVFKISYASSAVAIEGRDKGPGGKLRKVTIPVGKWALRDGEGHGGADVLMVAASRRPAFRVSEPGAEGRTKWCPMDSADMSARCAASHFATWELEGNFQKLKRLKTLKGVTTADRMDTSATFGGDQGGTRHHGMGAQIGIPLLRTHPQETFDFLRGLLIAQEDALRRAAAMSPEQLSAPDVEYTIMDDLLTRMVRLKEELMAATQDKAPRVYSGKGSRQVVDSDDSEAHDMDDGDFETGAEGEM